jgi:ribonuclease D
MAGGVSSDGEAEWIDTDVALAAVINTLQSEPAYALDTEFVAEKSYWPRLCLVQLAWPGGVALVDPLACDANALGELLRGPSMMVTHAGSADLPILERACGARPTTLFDTQVAAGFIGLGTPSLVSLVRELLGVQLDKSQQLTDWSRRPLSESARCYGAGDVDHLLALMKELLARLASRGREEWVADECEVVRMAPVRDVDPDTAWWRVKGGRNLHGEHARIAQSVAAWRERRAQEVDRPPRFVLGDLVLAGVTARPPSSLGELAALRGGENLPKAVAEAVLGAVEAGRAMARSELRVPPKFQDDAALDAAVGLLAAWTGQVASGEGIDARLLATRDDVRALVNGRPSRLDGGWRAAIVGDRIRDLLAGDSVLRLVDGGRRVQLEPAGISGSHGRDLTGKDGAS